MTNQFDTLIKGMEREIDDQKATRRRSSLTLRTVTHSTTVTAEIHRNSNGSFSLTKLGLAIINFEATTPQLFSASFASRSGRDNRGISIKQGYAIDNGAAIAVAPTCSATNSGNWDDDMAIGATRTINIPIYITATGEFTLTASQLPWEAAS